MAEDFDAIEGAECGDELGGGVTAAFDEFLDAGAAEFAEGGVAREAAGTAGELRVPIEGLPGGVLLDEVAGVVAHGGAMGLGLGDESVAAVVGNVEPLVAVGGPGVGGFEAAGEAGVARAGGSPESEGAINVNPRTVAARDGDESVEVIEAAVFTSPACRDEDGGLDR